MLCAHARAPTSTSGRFGLYQALGPCSLQETPEKGAEGKFRRPRTLPTACSLRQITTCKPRLLCLANRAPKANASINLLLSCSAMPRTAAHHASCSRGPCGTHKPHKGHSSSETWDQAMKGGFVFGTSTRGILSSPWRNGAYATGPRQARLCTTSLLSCEALGLSPLVTEAGYEA